MKSQQTKAQATYGYELREKKRPKRSKTSEPKIRSTYSITESERELLEEICRIRKTTQSAIIVEAIHYLASKAGLETNEKLKLF